MYSPIEQIDRTGDRRPAGRLHVAERMNRRRQEIAVAAPAGAEARAEVGQAAARTRAQQQLGRSERSAGDDDARRGERFRMQRAAGRSRPRQLRSRRRTPGCSRTRCSGRISRALLLRDREVVEVERVACLDGTADVAQAEVHAGALLDPVQVLLVLRRARDRGSPAGRSANRCRSEPRGRAAGIDVCQPALSAASCISFVRSGHCASGTCFTSIMRPTSA